MFQMILGTFKDRNVASGSGTSRQSRLGFSRNGPDSGGDDSDRDGDNGGSDLVGWAYIGSHNFTPSAWGTLSGSASCPVLNVCTLTPIAKIVSHSYR